MDGADNLEEIHLATLKKTGFQFLIPVDDGWWQALHGSNRESASSSSFAFLTPHIQRILQVGHVKASTTLSDEEKQETVSKLLGNVAREVHSFAACGIRNCKKGEFMGPMCSPLTKRHLPALSNPSAEHVGEYLVTEKSDGLRVIWVTHLVEDFPVWIGRPAQHNLSTDAEGKSGGQQQPTGFEFTLPDILTLERVRETLVTNNETSVQNLAFNGRYFRTPAAKVEERAAPASVSASGKDLPPHSHFSLEFEINEDGFRVPCKFDLERRPSCGRYFTYLFDRSMKHPFLLLEEIPFHHVRSLVCDGELLIPIRSMLMNNSVQAGGGAQPPAMIFAAFDLFQFTPRAPQQQREKQEGDQQPSQTRFLTDELMETRYRLLHEVLLRPLADHYHNRLGTAIVPPILPFSIQFHVKEMVRLKEMHLLVQKLVKARAAAAGGEEGEDQEESSRYIFNQNTYNDGFIFTPNRFPLAAGSSATQLKWKWPETLTVDWTLFPPRANEQRGGQQKATGGQTSAGEGTAKDGPLRCKAEMWFRKQQGSEEKKGNSLYGNITVSNPKNFQLKPEGSIVECKWDAKRNMWRMLRVRADKQVPNSAVTVVSVLESIAERITLETLLSDVLPEFLKACGEGGELFPGYGASALSTSGTSAADPKSNTCAVVDPAHLLVRAKHNSSGELGIVLQWTCRLDRLISKHPIVCNYYNVKNGVYGLGCRSHNDDPDSKLEGLLAIHLANDGGCYAWSETTVTAQFDPIKGMWAIGSLNRDKNKATVVRVLHHLEQITEAVHGRFPLPVLPGSTPREDRVTVSAAAGGTDNVKADIQEHYAQRARELGFKPSQDRSELRRHNNWIKACLIDSAFSYLKANLPTPEHSRLAVLDLCCGRGGDLLKWREYTPGFLMMVDNCFEAVATAAKRYSVTKGLSTAIQKEKGSSVPARFHVVDCFTSALLDEVNAQRSRGSLNASKIGTGFHLISCQYSMHYAFSSKAQAQQMLKNIVGSLRTGGLFVATTPDDRVLNRLKSEKKVGTEDYHVDFLESETQEDKASLSSFGAPYRVSYDVAVKNEVEFTVDWEPFCQLAKEAGLELVESDNFADYREKMRKTSAGRKLYAAIHHQMKADEDTNLANNSTSVGGNQGISFGAEDGDKGLKAAEVPFSGTKRTRLESDALDDEAGEAEQEFLAQSSNLNKQSATPACDPAADLNPSQLEASHFYRTLMFKKK